jgi:hypothetical protein
MEEMVTAQQDRYRSAKRKARAAKHRSAKRKSPRFKHGLKTSREWCFSEEPSSW